MKKKRQMKTKPNKVYSDGDAFCEQNIFEPSEVAEYIRKDALLEYIEKELVDIRSKVQRSQFTSAGRENELSRIKKYIQSL